MSAGGGVSYCAAMDDSRALMYRLLVLILVVLVFGALPLFTKRSDRMLHLFVALSTGIFLGVVFLHLLPEVAHMAEISDLPALVDSGHGDGVLAAGQEHAGHDHGEAKGALFAHAHDRSLLWPCVLVGVLAIFLIENLVLRTGSDRHLTVSLASLFGLSLHSFLTGVGLAAADATPGLSDPVYVSLLTHKGPEAFSLATVFLLAGFSRLRIFGIVAAFALVTPAGVLLGQAVTDGLPSEGLLVLLALSTGTFLFVALCDLLPEVFHHREDGLLKVVLVVLGVLVSTFLEGFVTG